MSLLINRLLSLFICLWISFVLFQTCIIPSCVMMADAKVETAESIQQRRYEDCKATQRCPRAFTYYDAIAGNHFSTSAAFLNGEEHPAALFADFEDWKQGTNGWKRVETPMHTDCPSMLPDSASISNSTHETKLFDEMSTFSYAVHADLEIRPDDRLLLNTTSASFEVQHVNGSRWQGVGVLDYVYQDLEVNSNTSTDQQRQWSFEARKAVEGIRVAVYNFLSVCLAGEVEIVGENAVALMSRTSMLINATILVEPGTVGGFPGGQRVHFYNAYGANNAASSARRIYLFTLEVYNEKMESLHDQGALYAPMKEVVEVRTFADEGQTIRGSFSLKVKDIRNNKRENWEETHPIPFDADHKALEARLTQFREVIGDVIVSRGMRDAENGYRWFITFDSASGDVRDDVIEIATNDLYGVDLTSVQGQTSLPALRTKASVTAVSLQDGLQVEGWYHVNLFGKCSRPLPSHATSSFVRKALLEDFEEFLDDVQVQRTHAALDVEHNDGSSIGCLHGKCYDSPGPSGELSWSVLLVMKERFNNCLSPRYPSFNPMDVLALDAILVDLSNDSFHHDSFQHAFPDGNDFIQFSVVDKLSESFGVRLNPGHSFRNKDNYFQSQSLILQSLMDQMEAELARFLQSLELEHKQQLLTTWYNDHVALLGNSEMISWTVIRDVVAGLNAVDLRGIWSHPTHLGTEPYSLYTFIANYHLVGFMGNSLKMHSRKYTIEAYQGGSGGSFGGETSLQQSLSFPEIFAWGGHGGGAVHLSAFNDVMFVGQRNNNVLRVAGSNANELRAVVGGAGGSGGSISIASGGVTHLQDPTDLDVSGGAQGDGERSSGTFGESGSVHISSEAFSLSSGRLDPSERWIVKSPYAGDVSYHLHRHEESSDLPKELSSSMCLQVSNHANALSSNHEYINEPRLFSGPEFPMNKTLLESFPYLNRFSFHVKISTKSLHSGNERNNVPFYAGLGDIDDTGNLSDNAESCKQVQGHKVFFLGVAVIDGIVYHGSNFTNLPSKLVSGETGYQFHFNEWVKVDFIFSTDEGWYDLRLNEIEVAVQQPLYSSHISFVGFYGYDQSMFWIDEVFLGDFEAPLFRCPTRVEDAKSYYDINELQEALNFVSLNAEIYDNNANSHSNLTDYHPKEQHRNHLTDRDYFQYLNSTGIVQNTGVSLASFQDESVGRSTADALRQRYQFSVRKLVNQKALLKTPSEFDPDIPSDDPVATWYEALYNVALNFSSYAVFNATGFWRAQRRTYLLGAMGACTMDVRGIFYNKGIMLNFVNLSYFGGVPVSSMVLNDGAHMSLNDTNSTAEQFESGSNVKIRHYQLQKVGLWRNATLSAASPRVLIAPSNTTSSRSFVMWFSVNDGLQLFLDGGVDFIDGGAVNTGNNEIELGVSGVATSHVATGPFEFFRTFLPHGNLTFDQTVLQHPKNHSKRSFLVRSYYTTVQHVVPEKIMQPIWESVKAQNGETDFSLSYHRAFYEDGYDDVNDVCAQRMRGETKAWEVVQREGISDNVTLAIAPLKKRYGQNSSIFLFPVSGQDESWRRYEYLGLGDPVLESRFKNPQSSENNHFKPNSVPAVKAQAWLDNYRDGNINDNPVHDTLADQYIGKPRVVFRRKASYVAISVLSRDLTSVDRIIKVIEGSTTAKDVQAQSEDRHLAAYDTADPTEDQRNNFHFLYVDHHLKASLEHLQKASSEEQLTETPDEADLRPQICDENVDMLFGTSLDLRRFGVDVDADYADPEQRFSFDLYRRRYFPRICHSFVENRTQVEALMLGNHLEGCNEALDAFSNLTELSTDPGQVWALDVSPEFRTEKDFIHRYHQYFVEVNDRNQQVVNFRDQVEQTKHRTDPEAVNRTNKERAFMRSYDHNCFRGPDIENGIPAEKLYQSELSQHYTKTEGINLTATTKHILTWQP